MKSHKGQSGFFKQIEEEQLKTKTMKLNLDEVNSMIESQLRVLKSRTETQRVYAQIDIQDYLSEKIKHQIEIGEMALLRLKKYKQKIHLKELIDVTQDINVMTEIMKGY